VAFVAVAEEVVERARSMAVCMVVCGKHSGGGIIIIIMKSGGGSGVGSSDNDIMLYDNK
jgi:hypothetical protein